jgi:hypothetical protein
MPRAGPGKSACCSFRTRQTTSQKHPVAGIPDHASAPSIIWLSTSSNMQHIRGIVGGSVNYDWMCWINWIVSIIYGSRRN